MSPRFVLWRENVPCVAEVVNRSLKADCTDFTSSFFLSKKVPHAISSSNSMKKMTKQNVKSRDKAQILKIRLFFETNPQLTRQ